MRCHFLEPTFRFAKREDLPQIVAIYNETIPSYMVTADLEPISVESRHNWFEQHTSDQFPLWTIELNNQVAGWMSLSPFKERPEYSKTAEISIYIAESFRGNHLGHKSLSFLEKQISNYSFETVIALVFEHNLASQSLFTRNGYMLWGHLPNVAILNHKHRDLLFLGKRYQ